MGTEEPHTTLSIMDIKKQALTSASHSNFTLEALRQIAPSAFTEVRDEQGELTHKVDFDVLKELLGDKILDSDEERFGFYWVGKQDAKRAAAEPTRKTLRPVLEDSVDWDNTQNLYIEGDNLEVLKLLQRAYLGRVKMIYIDPPYNTGNDFVYDDDFAMSREDMDDAMGNLDEDGNRLRRNLDSNPRYHSDWCSMIYSRLLVARTLLSNDGVIFISIDDNEVHHLRKICDEVFGAGNFVGELVWKKKQGGGNDSSMIVTEHEYVLVFSKSLDKAYLNVDLKYKLADELYPFRDDIGEYGLVTLDKSSIQFSQSLVFEIKDTEGNSYTPRIIKGKQSCWRWSQAKVEAEYDKLVFKNGKVYTKYYRPNGVTPKSLLIDSCYGRTETGNDDIKALFAQAPFSYPKPVALMEHLIQIGSSSDSLILDFFSGSATTAHAVMQLNAEDGGKRKYICVQLPEETPEGSEARKAGYDTICEIGKERIRRAGEQIVGRMDGTLANRYQEMYNLCGGAIESPNPSAMSYFLKGASEEQVIKYQEASSAFDEIRKRKDSLDAGFRVLRVDTSNMEEVYFEPAALQQDQLFGQVNSVKEDRSDLDLLFGCMVDWGVELSYPLRQEEVAGKHLYIVNEGALVACFEEDIDLEVIRAIAKLEPLRVLFRESCFASDAAKLNIYEQFKQLCGWSAEESYRRIHVM